MSSGMRDSYGGRMFSESNGSPPAPRAEPSEGAGIKELTARESMALLDGALISMEDAHTGRIGDYRFTFSLPNDYDGSHEVEFVASNCSAAVNMLREHLRAARRTEGGDDE